MSATPYNYKRQYAERYIFTSMGKKRIEKVVDFVPLGFGNLMNMGFGDLLPDGSIDDNATSNNGDITKVLATVIRILKDFIADYPQIEVFFMGSTYERTKLYTRILKHIIPVLTRSSLLLP